MYHWLREWDYILYESVVRWREVSCSPLLHVTETLIKLLIFHSPSFPRLPLPPKCSTPILCCSWPITALLHCGSNHGAHWGAHHVSMETASVYKRAMHEGGRVVLLTVIIPVIRHWCTYLCTRVAFSSPFNGLFDSCTHDGHSRWPLPLKYNQCYFRARVSKKSTSDLHLTESTVGVVLL